MLKDQESIPGKAEIDFNEHMGMPYHLDYTSVDEKGNLRLHATFDSTTSPQEIVEAFTQMAQSLTASTLLEKSHSESITVLTVKMPEKLRSCMIIPPDDPDTFDGLTDEEMTKYQIKVLLEEAQRANSNSK